MEVFLFSGFIPAYEGISGLNRPCGRTPAQAGYGFIIYKGGVFEMIADNLAITRVVMLLDEAVVEGFKMGVSDQFEFNGG